MNPGYAFDARARGEWLRASALRGADGQAHAEAGGGDAAPALVAWGAGLRSGVRVPELALIDVAPTIAELLGLRLEGSEGVPLVGALAFPVRTGSRSR